MRVLITGGSGKVGGTLMQTCPSHYELLTPSHNSFNLEDLANLDQQLHDIKPNALINCASYTAVDKAETEDKLANQVNSHAVGILASYCKEHSIPMIQVSTDYVFDGLKDTPYATTDKPNPLNQYGRSKLSGEIIARKNYPDVYIIRTSWIYSEHGNNFLKTMLSLARTGKPLRVIDDQIGSPTYAGNLAAFIWETLDKRPEMKLLHCSDKEQISWHDFALEIFKSAWHAGLIDEMPEISACCSSEYPSQAPRPAYSVLECAPSFATLELKQSNSHDSINIAVARVEELEANLTLSSAVGL
jgi:dTDP-4-dehydrorhamnose reductase